MSIADGGRRQGDALTKVPLFRVNIRCKVFIVAHDLVDSGLLGNIIIVRGREVIPMILLTAVFVTSLLKIEP